MRDKIVLSLMFCCSFGAMADDTVLKLYRPFGEVVEQVAPVVKQKLSGVCEEQSRLMLREDAWHCSAEGKVYDPCFAKEGAHQKNVICPQSPWSDESVEIEVNSFLNNADHQTLDMSTTFPWAIELVTGEHCQAVETNEVYDAMPVRYSCDSQNSLIGYIQRCKSVWSMLEKTPQGVVTVEFSKAWF